jgi:hypothetical protein
MKSCTFQIRTDLTTAINTANYRLLQATLGKLKALGYTTVKLGGAGVTTKVLLAEAVRVSKAINQELANSKGKQSVVKLITKQTIIAA